MIKIKEEDLQEILNVMLSRVSRKFKNLPLEERNAKEQGYIKAVKDIARKFEIKL